MRAPDYAQPLVGWRVWLLARERQGYRLKSLVQKVVWEPGRALRASCLRRRSHRRWRGEASEHEAPEERCACGIYATEAGRLGEYFQFGPIRSRPSACVFGRVSLWGTVLECERGWRASTAYPKHLYLPLEALGGHGPVLEEVALDLTQYGVPVELLEGDLKLTLLDLGLAA